MKDDVKDVTSPSPNSFLPPPPPSLSSRGLLLSILSLSLFTCFTLFNFISNTTTTMSTSPPSLSSSFPSSSSSRQRSSSMADPIFDALLHCATSRNVTHRMPVADMTAIAHVIRRLTPCNLLVFGLGDETPMWRALNHLGRTVYLDENPYYIASLESLYPGLEAYDISYTTKLADFHDLIRSSRSLRSKDCRPVQNLLFSECRLAINDMPNHLYDVSWDIILVDGPRGNDDASPGRMSSIFTSAVMARSGKGKAVDVLVHDYDRSAERICSEEFLCLENLVAETATPTYAHFVVTKDAPGRSRNNFCS